MSLSKFFVGLVCLSLLAIDAFQTWNAYDVRLKESNVLAANLARSLAQNADDTIKQADTILVGLVERLEMEGTGQRQLDRLQRLLVRRVAELPKLHGLFIYDSNGRWLTTNRNMVQNANNADREYFAYHRIHPDRTPYISTPVLSRSTGEWIIPVSRRFNHPDGRFAGVVLATVHMKYFRNFYDTFNIGKDGAILLAHMNGTILASRPFRDEKIGMNLKDSQLFREHLSNAPFGTYTTTQTYFDGLNRMVSYHRVEQFPLVAAVSMSKDEIFHGWLIDAARHFLISLSLIAVLGFLGMRLTRQIGHRLRAENELRLAQNKLESLNQELERMAMQDGLTGLANRRQFDLALNDEFNRAMRNGSSLALIMIDVDAFKQFNDRYGHPAGDESLRKISAVVKSCQKRAGDLAARYGGEEIAVLLPETDLAGALKVAELIHQNVRDLQIEHAISPKGIITVSCGVDAIKPIRHQHLPLDLLEGADKALYGAKSGGRDRVATTRTA